MRANQSTVLVGEKVVLVPYHERHVARYHEWMLDAHLRELTASEPLSLDEEYAMQRKWRDDDDKLTFIVLARSANGRKTADEEYMEDIHPLDIAMDLSPEDPGVLALPMVGDVNLFLKGLNVHDDSEAEVEVMIAEPSHRRKGLAREALQLLLSYATACPASTFGSVSPHVARSEIGEADEKVGAFTDCERNPLPVETRTVPLPPLPIPPSCLTARINQDNHASLALFSSLGFVAVRLVEVFGEVEMRWTEAEPRVTNVFGVYSAS